MSVEERTLVRALASQSGRALRVYPGHGLYLLTGLLTRLIGTERTERDAEDGHRAIPQVSETRRDVGDARRLAQNPATAGGAVTAEVTAPTPHNRSLGLPAASARPCADGDRGLHEQQAKSEPCGAEFSGRRCY